MGSTVITVDSSISLHYSHTANGFDYFGIHQLGTGFNHKLMDVVEDSTDQQVISEYRVRNPNLALVLA